MDDVVERSAVGSYDRVQRAGGGVAETSERALFVNPDFTSHIKGFTRRESDGLLELLYQQMIDQKYLVRYRDRKSTRLNSSHRP